MICLIALIVSIGILSVFFDAGRDRQSKRIEEYIVRLDAVFDRLFVGTTSDLQLVVGRSCHTVFVDQADDDAGTIAFGKVENL